MVQLDISRFDRDGLDVSFTSANSGGDKFKNTGRQFVVVDETNGSSRDLTFKTQNTVDGQDVNDRTVTVGANATALIGPFPTDIYNNSDDYLEITYSAVTGLNIAIVDGKGLEATE